MPNQKRLEQLYKRMETEGVEAFFIKKPENVFYLSGFSSSYAFILLYRREAFFLTDFRYRELAEKQLGSQFTLVELKKRSLSDALKTIFPEIPSLRMAFESQVLSYFEYKTLKGELPEGVRMVPSENWVEEPRQIKDQEEISLISQAQKIAERAYLETLNHVRAGRSEKEIARLLENYLLDFGAEGLAFPTIVVSGPRASLPHGQPTERILEPGDLVTLDMGCRFKGYCSDMTRTIGIGDIEQNKITIYNTVLEAQEAALSAIQAGVIARDIDAISRDHIREAGYGDYFGHGLGHSLGIEVHESPAFSPLCKEIIQENMVMTVEPGIYIPDFTGVRIEDLVVITKDGLVNLTSINKELQIL